MKSYNTYSILREFINNVFPLVDRELERWRTKAALCPDTVLSAQALSSISRKRFHTLGGSVYSIYPGAEKQLMVRLITAYQTISDYLDNLCDRAGVEDEEAFRCLHLAMSDSLDPSSPIHDYYLFYPYRDDGGYLISLVGECRTCINSLPSYELVKEHILEMAYLYSRLQVYKHINKSIRESKLFEWAALQGSKFPCCLPQEFCAAAGSTLGIFILLASSFNPSLDAMEVTKIKEAYFPWVCGLHILLDYFIDYAEDNENGDLNFVSYYNDESQTLERLEYYISSSLHAVSHLNCAGFHKTAVLGLLAMYLSDEKAFEPGICDITKFILSSHGVKLKLMHSLALRLRKKEVI